MSKRDLVTTFSANNCGSPLGRHATCSRSLVTHTSQNFRGATFQCCDNNNPNINSENGDNSPVAYVHLTRTIGSGGTPIHMVDTADSRLFGSFTSHHSRLPSCSNRLLVSMRTANYCASRTTVGCCGHHGRRLTNTTRGTSIATS